jgi:hypothetical protein
MASITIQIIHPNPIPPHPMKCPMTISFTYLKV